MDEQGTQVMVSVKQSRISRMRASFAPICECSVLSLGLLLMSTSTKALAFDIDPESDHLRHTKRCDSHLGCFTRKMQFENLGTRIPAAA